MQGGPDHSCMPGEPMLAALAEKFGSDLCPEEQQCFQAFQSLLRRKLGAAGSPAASGIGVGTGEGVDGAAVSSDQRVPQQQQPQPTVGHRPPGTAEVLANLARDAEEASEIPANAARYSPY